MKNHLLTKQDRMEDVILFTISFNEVMCSIRQSYPLSKPYS